MNDSMVCRAKFKVTHLTAAENGVHIVKMTPVTSGSPENENFFKWTPFGALEIGSVNEHLAGAFVPGQEFYLDFIKVEK